jgi:hypothetical protein
MMKLALRIIGWTLFVFMCFIIIEMFFDGSYVNYPDTDTAHNILLTSLLVLLVINIISALIQKDFAVLSIGNILFAIVALLVFQTKLSSYPPFGSTDAFSGFEFALTLCFYLSAVAFTVFAVWRITKFSAKHA